jgi:hypothetical protein
MLKPRYLEDIFIEFLDFCESNQIYLQQADLSAGVSFYNVISSGSQLTRNQANFIVKILEKYKSPVKAHGFDYTSDLENPQWKNVFRVLDLEKRIFVEKDDQNTVWVCMKFPFSIKQVFEKEISSNHKEYNETLWDAERKIRRLKAYNFNLIDVYEFAVRHGFEIDDTFMITIGEVEEIWQKEEEISPYCEKHFGATVDLRNASQEVQEWFEEHRTCNQAVDLLLAKSMGYPLKDRPETLVEKIAASDSRQFWLKSLEQFFTIYKQIDGPVAVIVNRSDSVEEWVKKFTLEARTSGVNSEDIRICFRQTKEEDHGFNQWVKDSGYGGKVEGAKIMIFQNKPPKWLFTDNIDVKLILTNSLYPVPSAVTQHWMDSHSCVCFVGDIKAAHIKEKKIVEL